MSPPTQDKHHARTAKFQMMMSPEEIAAIDDWRFENRIATRAEAIRRLCSERLNQIERDKVQTAQDTSSPDCPPR